MHTRLNHSIENSRIHNIGIKNHKQITPQHNIYEMPENLTQLPNGSLVSKKLKLTYGKEIDPHIQTYGRKYAY